MYYFFSGRKSKVLKLIKPLQCDCCHRVYTHWDATGHKCVCCGNTFSGVKGEKILSRLVLLGYLKKTVFRYGKKEEIIYNVLKEIEQPNVNDYLER